MNTDELSDLLRTLPPPMDGPPDRYEMVQRRAQRRARTIHAGVGGGVAAAVVVVTAALLVGHPSSTQSDSHDIATEPPAPTETVRYDPTAGPLPGATTAIDLSEPVAVTGTGTSTVELGSRPDGATAATVSVVCLTAGRIVYPDGASIVCDAPASESEIADPRNVNSGLVDLDPGQTSLRFRARQDVGWKVVANYVRTETSAWGVNAKGETFGVQRGGKSPDLIAVVTTDGKQGYAYVKDLDGRWTAPTSPADALAHQEADEGQSRSVPVYGSDGETVIGEYAIGP